MSSSSSSSSSTGAGSSSSSSSSSSSGGGGSSSSSSGCQGNCLWVWDPLSGWENIENNCQGECICREPYYFVGSTTSAGWPASLSSSSWTETTKCEPVLSPSVSTTAGVSPKTATDYAASALATEALLRLPDVHNPSAWKTFAKRLTGPWNVFRSVPFGWMVIFIRDATGQPATIHPNALPAERCGTAEIGMGEIGTAAEVILPESRGPTRYWVTVLEENRWVELRTGEWIVLFLKLPLDSGKMPPPA